MCMVAQTCALEHQSILKHFTLCFMSLDMVVVCCSCGSSGCEKVVRTHFFFSPDMSSGPSVELIMWKWRQEVLQVQAETEAHMVEIATGTCDMDCLVQLRNGATCTLVRLLQEQTSQVIGACALMQDGCLRAPYPSGMNPTASYQEFIAELETFTNLKCISIGFAATSY